MPFNFRNLQIKDVISIVPIKFNDDRGFFEETFKETDFANFGINTQIKQINFSHSSKGVLRGLHYQLEPYTQSKIVRVVHGKIIDVAVDLRIGSPTFGKWVSQELDSKIGNMLFIPKGFAHGFAVLSETAVFQYKCDEFYHPEADGGISILDGSLGIDWRIPVDKAVLSEKDTKHPLLKDFDSPFEL